LQTGAHDHCSKDNNTNVGVVLESIPSFANSMRIIRAHMIPVGNEHNLTTRRRFIYAPTVGQKGVHQYALEVAPIGKFSFVEDEHLGTVLRVVV
jgi:hypothetical protein